MHKDFSDFVQQHDYPCWCGSSISHLFCRQRFRRRFAVMECRACGTQRILPKALQSQSDAGHLYNKEAHTRAELEARVVAATATRILKRIEKVGLRFDAGMTVVDVGCSEGLLLETIRHKYQCKVFGVDVDERTIARARRNYPEVNFLHGLAHEQLPNLPKADVVIASAILEHVTDPQQFLSELAGLLKPNGQIFLLTPNAASFHYRVARSWWRELLAIGEHIYLFSPTSLAKLALRCGLLVESVTTDYDRLVFPNVPRSLFGTVVCAWSWIRCVVKAACLLCPRKLPGDILSARLEQHHSLQKHS